MIDIVVQVVTEVAKCLAAPIGRQFSYLRNYSNNLQGLKDEVEKLTDERECVHHRVDDANRKGEEIEQGVQRWLTSVDKTIKDADKIIKDEGKSLCLKGLCPNLKTRYQLSKDAVRKLNDIERLREEGGKFEVVSYRTLPEEIWLPATKGYESFESRMETMRDIQKALSDPNVSMIGVYGMGGIGKTTLVKEIASLAEKDFDEVAFARVSDTPNIREIQGEIADKIGLEFREETVSGRARKLRERLSGGKKNPSSKEATHPYLDTSSFKVETEAGRNTKQELSIEKKVLVILDDIWKDLDLETIGIPLGQNNKGCKVLLTTRILDVLTDKMNCHHNIQVGSLHEEEAWSLFKKMAGDGIENPDLQPIAIDIAKECSGLPIAIVTVARALRNKRLHQWKSALQDLRNPSERSLTTGVQAEAYSCIELSYKYLEDDEHRSTFLLCSLIGDNDFYFPDLLKYSIGLGLIQAVKTMEGARDKLYTLLDKLKASCLLLDGQTSEWFSMHDVVRDVALSIATRDQHIFTVGGETVSIRWPNKDIPEGCTSITLYECNIGELVDGLECPRLELLHISNNSFLKIHENFFTGMTKLKVLRLTSIQLLSLPSSICLLGNLRTLCLDQSELGDIAIIGEVKKLEILSFVSSNIEQLPKEIGQLSCLKLLDLTHCYQLKFIPANVISSLSQLEELYMGNTFIQWDHEGSNTERKNASLHELMHLSRLTNLEIHIKDARILPRGLFSEKLERYKIYIGDEWVWSRKYEGTRTLKLKVNTNMCMEDEVTMQLKKIEVLYLDELQGTDSVLCKADKEGFPQLKHLHVQNNPYFRCILGSMEWLPHEAFPQLESLFLSNLIKMEKICNGQLTAKSFCKLNILKVDKCDNLKNVFSLSMVESLPQLETMEVAECKSMEVIFAVGRKDNVNNNEVNGKIELGQIRFLTLKYLPKVNSFCSKMKIPSMSVREIPKDVEIVLEDDHYTTTTLFNEMVLLPKLEALEVSAINCEKIWQNQLSAISSCFQNLTRLIVQGCGYLKYIFSSSILGSFLNLQHLEVCRCPVLEEILVMDSSREEEERKSIIFPRLNFLKLEDLENLPSFCSEYDVEFTSLKQLEIKQCPKFKSIVLETMSTDFTTGEEVGQMSLLELHAFFNEKAAFPELEEMVISNLDNLKTVWDNKLAHQSFRKLKLIKIEDCNELVTLFPSNMFKRFAGLEFLTIKNCASLEKIFEIQELDFEETHSPFLIQLKQVNVSGCGSLKNIFQASIAKRLLQLDELDVRNCGVLTEIVAKKRGDKASAIGFVFPKVSSLVLAFLPKLTTFYPGTHTSEWQVLEELVVVGCENVKTFASEIIDFRNANDEVQLDIIPAQQPFFLVEQVMPRLKILQLDINDIIMICHGQFARHHFSTLNTLVVRENEAAVFSLGLLERFYNLKTLTLADGSRKELFSYNDIEKHVENFQRIIHLRLEDLSQMKHIWRQDSKLNSILQNLEILELNHCDSLINLVPSSATFRNLTTLEVCYCERMVNLITSSTAKSMQQLKQMTIEGCKGMTEIVANEGDAGGDEIIFNKLEVLSLDVLESLTSFCSMKYTFRFPSLEVLIVRDCPKMKIFCQGALSTSKLKMVCQNWEDSRLYRGRWDGDLNATIQQLHRKMVELRNKENMEVSAIDFEKSWQNQYPEMASRFQNLKCLIVQGYGNLTCLFSLSIVRSFLQLQHLEIYKCPSLHEIIAMEELREEERKDIVFPRLNFLKIEDLEKVTQFCSESYVEFPSLKKLEIKQCPEFKAFFLKNLTTVLAGGEVGKMGSRETQHFFPDKVAFPNLEEMMISQLDELEMIWHEKLDHHSFGRLKLMKIEACNKLVTLFPSYMLGRFSRLESLTINDCGSLEEIFGSQRLDFETRYSTPVNKLKLVSVSHCKSLKNIFQASIAKTLLQLEQLDVSKCGALTEIVARDGGVEASTVRLVFPKVIRLRLIGLRELSTFFPGEHISEWPVLKELRMFGCQKVKVFASESLDFQITGDKGQLDIPTEGFLFLLEKISPGLELLGISSKDIMMTCHSQFTGHLFTQLNTLIIGKDEAPVFRLGMLERFYNLTKLTLGRCSYKELFSTEEVEQDSGNLARIKSLWLQHLSDLKHMWKQDSKFNSLLKNLEVLHLDHCDSLKSLVPSSASFQSLTTLEVYYCMGMINMVSSSTARTLERLKRMSIEGCQRLTEIIPNEEHVAEDEIVFSKLEELSLIGLESLESFCSVNYSFKFPSLDVLIVRDCPKMKIFCEGALSTSKLQMVCQNREEWRFDKGCWEGDLNATMQRLHQNKVELHNSQNMEVSATDFEKIWQKQSPEMTSRFENLKHLTVQGSGNLTYLFSSSMVRSFLQLQHLEICKCPALHEIIKMEELREEERKDIIFPQLSFLKIEDLENLTRFCLESYVEFPSLKQLEIKQCPEFKAFVLKHYMDLTTAGEVGKMSSMEIQPFFNDMVALPDLDEMVFLHLDNLKMVWHNKLAPHSFSKLKSVKVEGCDKLLTLFPSSMFGRLSRLESLTVDKCGSLEAIFGIWGSNFEETHTRLDLELMSVTKCQNLKIIFPIAVARSLLQLKGLQIIDCGILEEIVSKEGREEASAVKFFFPKAASLVLKNLPALTNFYPGVHTSEWPMLEELVVYSCKEVQVFAPEYLYFQRAKDESHLDIPVKQPLFVVEKIIPRLEVLALSGQEIMKIFYGQFPRHLFSKIKGLGIREDESAVFPLGLLERFYNLESLKLRHGSYKELFSNGEVEKHAGSLAGIKKLLLESLSDMKYLWKQDVEMNLVLQNLEILEVEKCDSLVSLLPPSAFFLNLTTLKVCYCNEMMNLATSLTAKSLQHLRNISIEECQRMTEIVANEGDKAEDEIVFSKLEELSLVGLESLISFCSMNCAFNFPSLDVLIVRDCPKLKNFCEGPLIISKLEIVCQNREDWFLDKGCWEGDLNTTIQQLHNKMNVLSSKEDSGQPSEDQLE